MSFLVMKCPNFFSLQFLIHIVFILVMKTNSSAFVEERICATLYSGVNFDGEKFTLKDFDQVLNTRKDYRSLITGWTNTGSLRVENNCNITICDGTYFRGNCYQLFEGDHKGQRLLRTTVASAKCSCLRECACNAIFIPKNERTCGRVYLGDSCNTCDSEYFQLYYFNAHEWYNFPNEYENSLTFVLRNGCNLTIYSETGWLGEGITLTAGHVQNFSGKSYACDWNDEIYINKLRPSSYPRWVKLPNTQSTLLEMLTAGKASAHHPGLHAALRSLQSGRSFKNAYILLIGEADTNNILFTDCQHTLGMIGECHHSVKLDELGIENAQIRIINVPVAYKHYDGVKDDERWAGSLNDYLSTHKDLKSSIPNVVIIRYNPVYDLANSTMGSSFQRKLKLVSLLRGRLLDENFSNLVFILKVPKDKSATDMESYVDKMEKLVTDNWSFPRPTTIVQQHDLTYITPKLNGHWKLTNGKYWPKTLQDAIMLACEKGGDSLGRSLFQTAFLDEMQSSEVSSRTVNLLPRNSSKFIAFLRHASTISGEGNLTEIFMQKKEKRKVMIEEKINILNGQALMEKIAKSWTEQQYPDCYRHRWLPISEMSKQIKNKAMNHFGYVDIIGRRIYVCRGVVNGAIRVGSFIFEEGVCRVFYKRTIAIEKDAEILIIPGFFTENHMDTNGILYRYQYDLVSSLHISEFNVSTDKVMPIFAGNSHSKNKDKFIAFASLSVKFNSCTRVMDLIGTALLGANKPKKAIFAGVNGKLESEIFKVLVCTRTKVVSFHPSFR